jgi:transcriptional regulator with XRE-family HTH domain
LTFLEHDVSSRCSVRTVPAKNEEQRKQMDQENSTTIDNIAGQVDGRALRDIRVRRGPSLTDIAKRMGYAKSRVSAIETGHAQPTTEFIRRYVEALGLRVTDLPLVKGGSTTVIDADKEEATPEELIEHVLELADECRNTPAIELPVDDETGEALLLPGTDLGEPLPKVINNPGDALAWTTALIDSTSAPEDLIVSASARSLTNMAMMRYLKPETRKEWDDALVAALTRGVNVTWFSPRLPPSQRWADGAQVRLERLENFLELMKYPGKFEIYEVLMGPMINTVVAPQRGALLFFDMGDVRANSVFGMNSFDEDQRVKEIYRLVGGVLPRRRARLAYELVEEKGPWYGEHLVPPNPWSTVDAMVNGDSSSFRDSSTTGKGSPARLIAWPSINSLTIPYQVWLARAQRAETSGPSRSYVFKVGTEERRRQARTFAGEIQVGTTKYVELYSKAAVEAMIATGTYPGDEWPSAPASLSERVAWLNNLLDLLENDNYEFVLSDMPPKLYWEVAVGGRSATMFVEVCWMGDGSEKFAVVGINDTMIGRAAEQFLTTQTAQAQEKSGGKSNVVTWLTNQRDSLKQHLTDGEL